MPEITLSLPAALGFLALFLTIGAVLVFFTLRGNSSAATDPTVTPTATILSTVTMTSTVTNTPLPDFTATPEPPTEYTVKSGDSCQSIANLFGVDMTTIINANGLSSTCNNLVAGSTLKIPRPTPTALPQPSATLSAAEKTETACDKVNYTVQDGDTLGKIAANYGVTADVIKAQNGLVNDSVFSGTSIVIPLCNRDGSGTTSATATPTTPPPYAAPNLLLPANGAAIASADQTVTLQWASVGTLRANESYAVTVVDLTAESVNGEKHQIVEYVTDQKYTIPSTFRPADSQPHIISWSVLTVRQTGTTKEGEPIWSPAGEVSAQRVFTWNGSGSAEPGTTPTP